MKPITIKDIQLHPVALPVVEPLQTSFGTEDLKGAIVVEVITEGGIHGWGEASVETRPAYGAEDMITGMHILQNFVKPALLGKTIEQPTDTPNLIKFVRGNHHAKSGIEAAIWDAFAKTNAMRLVDLFAQYTPEGHTTTGKVHVGVSIGIQPTLEATIAIIQKRLDQGYTRIKLKIKPGWDIDLAAGVRERFPDILLMLDANSAYTLEDTDHLAKLNPFNLLMIEQPLAHDDIYEHGKLQPHIQSPICLDESVKSVGDLLLALEIGAIRILNLKPARVGGFTESLKIYNVCVERSVPLWIGGMLEVGIGRAANAAFASLPGVTLPCDISATDRYFDPDITEPPFVLNPDSTLTVPDGIGIGVEVQQDRLEAAVQRWHANNPYKGS